MLEPSKRFATLVLAAGVIVLVGAIAIGERMGDRVLAEATGRTLGTAVTIAITPAPDQTDAPYGPDWKRSSTLAAAPDPGFPDPRIPPVPLPTRPPVPSPSPTVRPTPTLNPNIPIWRQIPIPTFTPSPAPSSTGQPVAAESPSPVP